jgi:hypothetical protein
MQWREYGIEQGELSCIETKTEILLLSWSLIYLFILRGIFQGVLVSHVYVYWCPQKSLFVCARPHKLIKVHLFIFAPYKVTNSIVDLLVVFAMSLVTHMSNTEEELLLPSTTQTLYFPKKTTRTLYKEAKSLHIHVQPTVEVTQSYLIFAYLCPNNLSNFAQSYMERVNEILLNIGLGGVRNETFYKTSGTSNNRLVLSTTISFLYTETSSASTSFVRLR